MCVVCPQLKLEDYRRRLSRGEMLNKDQMVMPTKMSSWMQMSHMDCDYLSSVFVFQVAVEKYKEVLHHLAFAQELHKTLDGLTQSVSPRQSDPS